MSQILARIFSNLKAREMDDLIVTIPDCDAAAVLARVDAHKELFQFGLGHRRVQGEYSSSQSETNNYHLLFPAFFALAHRALAEAETAAFQAALL
jgi:hypothetical protein